MGSITGNEGVIKLSGEQVIQARSWSLDETSDTAENTVIGSEARTYKKSMVSWSGSLDVFYDTEDIAVDDLTPGVQIDLQLYPDGDGPGSLFFVGLAIITSITNGAAFDGMTERSISFQGTGLLIRANYIGAFEGNDSCDKPGDIPGECTEPDFRNPSERFEERTFEEGDFYTISQIIEGEPGHVNLVDEDDLVIRPIQVYNAETIAFRTTTAPAGIEGWYLLQRDIIAADVAFDDTGTYIKGENVQDWNEAADLIINDLQRATIAADVVFDDAGTTIKGEDVQAWNEAADLLIVGALQRSGGTMTGPLLTESHIRLGNGNALQGRNLADDNDITICYVGADDIVHLGSNNTGPQTMIRAAGVVGIVMSGTTVSSRLLHELVLGALLANNVNISALSSGGVTHGLMRLDSTNRLIFGVATPVTGGSEHLVFQNGVQAEHITDTYHRHDRTTTHTRQDQTGATGAVTINFQEGARHNLSCTGAVQLSFTAPIVSASVGNFMIQIATGGNVVTPPAGVYWPDGEAPVINAGFWIMSLYWSGSSWYATAQQFAIA